MISIKELINKATKDASYSSLLGEIMDANRSDIEKTGCVYEALKIAIKTMDSLPAFYVIEPIRAVYCKALGKGDDNISESDTLFILMMTNPNGPLLADIFNDNGTSGQEVFNAIKSKVSPDLFKYIMHTVQRKSDLEDGDETEEAEFSCLYDLTEQVKEYPVRFIGREDIIDQTILVLNRKLKHNVIHIGEPGVGKTACTLGLAQKIVKGQVPKALKGMKVYSLDVAALMAGTEMRGAMESELISVLDFVSATPAILYIDEIHTIAGAGRSSGSSLDVAGILKPYLSGDSDLRIIGATTNAEFRKYIENDKSLARRFQVVRIEEPSVEETVDILKGLQKDFEKYHHVKYSEESLIAAAELSSTHIRNKCLPDKAIDVMDLAGSKKNLAGEKSVDVGIVRQMVAEISGIPVGKTVDDREKLKDLEAKIEGKVFGQDSAVKEIVRCVKMSKAGLNEDDKPIASFLFVGPTGVGKTEVAKALANELGVALLRFDMSEYADKMSVSKFIGASAGYIGYEDGGLLVNKVRENPYSVLLLDEIEKADPQIFNALLQVMDNATLTDSKGNVADFRNIVIIMTSNAGAREIKKKSLGFNTPAVQIDKTAMDNAVKTTFSPEFRGRLTATVKFSEVTPEMAEKIAVKQLNLLCDKLKKKKVSVEFSDELVKEIVLSSDYEQSGGRAIVSVVDEKIKPLFVDELLFGKLKSGGTVTIRNNEGVYTLD